MFIAGEACWGQGGGDSGGVQCWCRWCPDAGNCGAEGEPSSLWLLARSAGGGRGGSLVFGRLLATRLGLIYGLAGLLWLGWRFRLFVCAYLSLVRI